MDDIPEPSPMLSGLFLMLCREYREGGQEALDTIGRDLGQIISLSGLVRIRAAAHDAALAKANAELKAWFDATAPLVPIVVARSDEVAGVRPGKVKKRS